jgi:hypothetical protein
MSAIDAPRSSVPAGMVAEVSSAMVGNQSTAEISEWSTRPFGTPGPETINGTRWPPARAIRAPRDECYLGPGNISHRDSLS